MEFRVEELAARAGTPVDTLRYYQTRGLLPPPRRAGRVAWYGEAHLQRLLRIRRLAADGFTLGQIARLLADADSSAGSGSGGDAELLGLLRERLGGRMFSRAEFAAETGLPEALIASALQAGLVEPLLVNGAECFTEDDVAMAKIGLELLQGGFPLQALLDLAVEHAQHTAGLADRAIALFGEHVRRRGDGAREESGRVAEAFRLLLPQVTKLVALHFQRTLVTRALAKLAGDDEDLRDALAATGGAKLSVQVGWI